MTSTYSKAGVDIDAGDVAVQLMKEPGTSEKNDVFFSFEFGDRCASMATVVVAEV